MQNVIVCLFDVESEGYQAITELRNDPGNDKSFISQAVLIKKENGALKALDSFDTGAKTSDDTAIGGLIGMCVGVLGGPIGMLLGAGWGSLAGMTLDAADAADGASLIEQIADKLDKGLLDFLVLAEYPDSHKYEFIEFPESDRWGLVIPKDDPLAGKKSIRAKDLAGLPLFCSEQAWNNEVKEWAGSDFSKMKLEGSFRLSYNGSIFAKEGLGYLLTFDHLVDTSDSSGLVFRPLAPKLETKLYIAWNRYQAFTPIAERFLEQLQRSFVENSKDKK